MKKKEIKKLSDKKKSQSIECKKAGLKAGQIIHYLPTIHPILNELVYECKLKLGPRAIILEELDPKESKIDRNSMLNSGDKISGRVLECLSTAPITSRWTTISGKHTGNLAIAKKYVYCKVFIPIF